MPLTVIAPATTITSLNRVNATPSNASTVNWTLTFAAPVTGVTASNFSLSGAAATGASVGPPATSNGGLTWNVPVTTGSTDGTLTLSVANATGLTPGVSTSLPFATAGQTYTMDKTRPTVSIGAPSASSVGPGGSVSYTVTYADANFASSSLTTGGISLNTTGGASGTIGLSGSGTSYTVTISSITGAGTIGITVGANTSLDAATNANLASAASTTFNVVSNNADLSALALTTATINEFFSAATTAYTSSVPNATSSVTVTATRAQANATLQVRVNGGSLSALTSGSPSGALALNVGANTIDVKVTAQDAVTTKTYTITVTRRSIIEDWRLSFFADASGTSTRANGADFDLDGKTNLLEFAFGTDPTLGSSGPSDLTMTGTYAAATFGTTGQPTVKLEPITNGVDFRALFIRRVDHAAAGLTYTPEFSADDFGSFTASVAVPTVLATSGGFQLVSVPYPHFLPNGKKARYFRVTVNITP